MGEQAEALNYDFNYNMFLTKTFLTNLPSRDQREKAVRWMRKLSTCNKSIDEMKLRNDFLYYLVLNAQEGELKAPFNEAPPNGPLLELARMLPIGAEAQLEGAGKWAETSPMRSQKPMLYSHSPDGGAFLAAQPIPRCGAFCYLAVVSRTKE